MTIDNHQVFSDTFEAFWTLLNKKVIDPEASNRKQSYTQWVFSSDPDEDIAQGKIIYPILIISPVEGSNKPFTVTKNQNNLAIDIAVYHTKMSVADQLFENVCTVIDSYRRDLRREHGLSFITLEGSRTGTPYRGGTKVHERIATFIMRKTTKSGLSKITYSQTIASNAVIAAA